MSRGGRTGRTIPLRVAGLSATVLLLAACTGQPASTSSWQGAADRALGAAISGLGTARVALDVERRDRGPHAYVVVTVTDAIETSSKEVSGFEISQPPDALHRAHQAVDEALDAAVSLMVQVRVALASPGIDDAQARSLAARVDALRKELDDLDSTVRTSPGSLGRP